MLTLTDCLGLCELTAEEVDAIAEHEHVPEILAAEIGAYLLRTDGGPSVIARMVLDDIDRAVAQADHRHAAKLKLTLRHFCESHADAGTFV